MTEDEQFAACDAPVGNTMLVFGDEALAFRYTVHRHRKHGQIGIVVCAKDTREGTGICVIWRDRCPADQFAERMRNCQWLLEEVLAGRQPRPIAGQVVDLGKVGGKAA